MSLDRFESPTLDYRMAAHQVNVGEVFAGRYRIVRLLKVGGMSFVYEAFDEKVQQKIALKILKPGLTDDETTIRRFQGEVRLARRIGHQNVCRIFDLEESNGVMFISMEMIEGVNLKEHIQKSGPMPEQEGIRFCIQALEGLQSAHSSGIIHRDLKPQNIMIDNKGNPRILDFGLSRALDTEGVTLFGAVMGTPGYMAPEQGLGETAEERSDLYSVGAIMYEMFTGTLPFQAETPAKLIYKHVYTAPADPRKKNPTLSPSLSKVILKCLEKKKERRYRNVNELIQALRLLEEGKTLPTNLVSAPKFRPAILALIIAALAVVGTVGYLSYQYLKKPEKRVAVTVLPIRNQTGKSELDNLIYPITQAMINSLFNSEQVKVYPYDSIYQASGLLKEKGVPDKQAIKFLGELNGSSYVIVPTLFLLGNTLRADLEWRDPRTGEPLKTKTLEYKIDKDPTERINDFIHDAVGEIQKETTGKEGEYTPFHTDLEVLLAYNSARNAFLHGNYPEAIQYYHQTLKKDSGFPDSLLGLADSYHQMGYDSEAARFARQASLAAAERSLPEARRLRIQAKLAEINYDFTHAEQLYRQLKVAIPDDPTLFVALGSTLERLAKNREAHAAFVKAIDMNPYYTEAYIREARLLADEGRWQEALTYLDRAFNEAQKLQNYDLQASILMDKSNVYRDRGDFPEAEKSLKNAEALSGNFQNPLVRARILKLEADIRLLSGSEEVSLVHYEEPYKLFQDAHDLGMLGSIQINIGNAYLLRGEFPKAEEYFRKAEAIADKIQSYKLQAEAFAGLGNTFYNQDQYQNALTYFNKALSLDKKTGNQHGIIFEIGRIADIFLLNKDYNRAFQAYTDQLRAAEKLGKLDDQAQALAGLGEYSYLIEVFPEAEKKFQKALEINQQIKNERSERYCALYLAKTLTRLGRFGEADQFYTRAEQLAKKSWPGRLPETWSEWGWNQLQKGNWTEGRKFFENASSAAGKNRNMLAEFYLSATPFLENGRADVAQMNQLFLGLSSDLQLQLTPLMVFAFERAKEPQKALELLLNQIPNAKQTPVTHWLLLSQMANLQKKLGNEKEASQFSQEAQELLSHLQFQPKGKVTETLLKT